MDKKSPVRQQNSANGTFDGQSQQSQEQSKFQQKPQDSSNSKTANSPSYPFLNRVSSTSEPQHSQVRPGTEPLSNRLVERENPTSSHSPFSSESLRRLREERLAAGSHQQNPALSPSSIQHRAIEQINDHQSQPVTRNPSLVAPTIDARSVSEGVEPPSRTGEDQSRHHRTSLALLIDNNRRGRISPLPQAVQGAQGRISGPASDPGIKNEFSKMFMGIGAGVSRGGRLGSGTSSPFPPSPTKNLEQERRSPFARRGDLAELTKPRSISRGSRKGRKTKEEEVNLEPETAEVGVSTGVTRGMKRSRHTHLHHPHQHSHQ